MVNKSIKSQIEALSRDKQTNLNRRNYKEVAEICNYLGELLSKEGRYEDAINEHETELEMCEKLQDALGKAIANRKLGECYCALGSFDKALAYQQQHLVIARELGNELEQQRAHATLGRTYLCKAEAADDVRGALAKAEQSFQSSLSIALVLKGEIDSGEYFAMVGRLYLNLGLVAEMSGQITRAIKYLHDARTEISGKKLEDEEQKCLSTLSALYQKTGNVSSAREFAEKAYVLSKRLKEKSALVECLQLRAGIFMESEQFSEARHCLKRLIKSKFAEAECKHKAKRMLNSLPKLREGIGKLKKCDDKVTRLSLLEVIGDLYCGCECYYTGLRYYKKMLETAIDCDRPNGQLASIYVSLAQTAADLKMYKEAVKYCLEEVKLRIDPVQLCKTWLNIADYTYRSESNDDLTIDMYNNAIREAEKADNSGLLLQCLQELRSLYRSSGDADKTTELDDRIRRLRIRVDASEDDDDEEQTSSRSATPDFDDLSSVTESDDEQGENEEGLLPRKRGQYKVRRNEKGETPLHVAVINGSLKRVRHLINQGHPVNERDYCGWLPIHEAANHNHLEIAKLLIENNALLDDQGGGSQCDGMTPIVDAANCGNLDMVRLLFDRGANLLKKDRFGNTVIDALYAWKNGNLDEDDVETKSIFENLIADLQGAMLQSGAKPNELRNKTAGKSEPNQTDSKLHRSHKSGEKLNSHFRRQRSASPHLDSNPTEIYREAIVGIGSSRQRKRKRSPSPNFQKISNDDALIRAEDFIGDDWLVEDVITADKQPVNKNAAALLFTSGSRQSPIVSSKRPAEDLDMRAEPKLKPGSQASTVSQDSAFERVARSASSKISSSRRTVRNPDVEILELPDEEDNDDEELATLPMQTAPSVPAKERSFECAATIHVCGSSVRRLRIRIQDMVVLVPLTSGSGKTISWLAEEAATRYAEAKGLQPRLQLMTSDGAVLSLADQVSDVVGELEEVCGLPTSWDMPPIGERYTKACQVTKTPLYQNILQALNIAVDTGQLVLDDLLVEPSSMAPIFRSLQFQSNIRHFSCEGCLLNDFSFPVLNETLVTMPHLTSLNLSCANMTETSLEIIRGSLNPTTLGSVKPLQMVTKLDLSHNNFSNAAMKIVADILTSIPNLEEVKLDDCGFSTGFLDDISSEIRGKLEKCEKLRTLSFAMNHIGAHGFLKTLMCCSNNVWSVNLSGTIRDACAPPACLYREIDNISRSIRELSLTYCKLDRKWLHALSPLFKNCLDLNKVSFEGNRELGGEDVRLILRLILRKEVSWSAINLSGLLSCDECWPLFQSIVENCPWVREMSITFQDATFCEKMKELWRTLRGDRVVWDKPTGTVFCMV
ncbi:tonsoku-like protein [Paramacrobiotus metropolitanus]|uniref:tonsoku-like protein n=1 Tax=Paramacrobiotus metropolitanus TaxID=2943436 RepID=UPI0024462EB7|nr:tonsoku-like protein [Paramacrobiotus metropolitanus]